MIIGLTGGIASGKSLCSDWFAARAIAVVDADVVARTVGIRARQYWGKLLLLLAKMFCRQMAV